MSKGGFRIALCVLTVIIGALVFFEYSAGQQTGLGRVL